MIFSWRVCLFVCFLFSNGFYFFAKLLVICVYYFPDFVYCPCVFSHMNWAFLGQFTWILCQALSDRQFSRVGYSSFVSFLHWCHGSLFFVTLVSLCWYVDIWRSSPLFPSLPASTRKALHQSAQPGMEPTARVCGVHNWVWLARGAVLRLRSQPPHLLVS